MKLNTKAREFIRDFVYSMRDAGHEFPESKRVELTHGIENICESLLLEAERRLPEPYPPSDLSHDKTTSPHFYNKAIKGCKQVLRNMRGADNKQE